MTTGLKQTITKQKDKRQKRFMLDILRNLYMKYESENNERISFTTFWRLKPFCKTSENLSFMVKVLFRHQVISTPNTNILVQQVVCSTQRMNCMYGNCEKCQEKQIETKPFDQNLPVVYSQWVSEKEKREFQNRNQRSHCHQKKRGGDQFMDLLARVHNELWLKYRKHFFNIKNQFNHYRTTRETLTST
jgi:tRNA uridine 5-carbamoylmethylation protein Kti12